MRSEHRGELPHVLVAGWYRHGTGFTRVLKELVSRFATSARITWIGIGATGAPRVIAPNVTLVPVQMGRGDPVGAYLIAEHWAQWQPDAVFALNDLWYLEHYARVLGPIRGGVPLIGYMPLDGRIPEALVLPDLTAFTTLVTYTRTAADDLRRHLAFQHQDIQVDVAGHGVDIDNFVPDCRVVAAGFDPAVRHELARELFGLDEPTLVVLNASRADPRKRIDLTIDAFAKARSNVHTPMKLCLHQAIGHSGVAEQLRSRIDALGIDDSVIWWPKIPTPLDDAALCRLYNACGIGVNTTMGEGFGLVSFEHAACGVPQIVPAHDALIELWGDAATIAGPVPIEPQIFSPLHMGAVDPASVGVAIAALANDPGVHRRAAERALAHTRSGLFHWDGVAKSLRAHIDAGIGVTGIGVTGIS